MIRTTSILLTAKDFANESGYILETVLNLDEQLVGQSHSIPSIFQADSNPSMVLFIGDEGYYRFKDFSSGQYGDYVDIVQYTNGLSTRKESLKHINEKILFQYVKKEHSFVKIEKKITDVVTRRWIVDDELFWRQFGITGKTLLKYNIKPLSGYMHRKYVDNKEESSLKIDCNGRTYGYFDKSGDIYKIYNPGRTTGKFLKNKDYIQGYDQLTFDSSKILIICASMKDFMALEELRIGPIECVAAESENVILNGDVISLFKSNYKKVYVLLDNDVVGMKNMKLYYDLFSIQYIHVKLEKDIAEAVKQHGKEKAKEAIRRAIKEAQNRKDN